TAREAEQWWNQEFPLSGSLKWNHWLKLHWMRYYAGISKFILKKDSSILTNTGWKMYTIGVSAASSGGDKEFLPGMMKRVIVMWQKMKKKQKLKQEVKAFVRMTMYWTPGSVAGSGQ